jgi:hypothetical protein
LTRNARQTIGRLALLLLLPGCPALRADALADLHSVLKRLQSADPVTATLEYQFRRETTEDGSPSLLAGSVTTRTEDGPLGLRVAWDRATLLEAEAESRASAMDPATPNPIGQIMRLLTAIDIAEHLHAGETLDRILLRARLQETRPEPWEGKPATLLVLNTVPVISPPNLRSIVKDVQGQARIWVGADGTPLAWIHEVNYKGSKYLVRFQGTLKEEIHFQRSGNRLLCAWAQNDDRQSGLGQTLTTHRVYRIALN